jgi:hypothetical protein
MELLEKVNSQKDQEMLKFGSVGLVVEGSTIAGPGFTGFGVRIYVFV